MDAQGFYYDLYQSQFLASYAEAADEGFPALGRGPVAGLWT